MNAQPQIKRNKRPLALRIFVIICAVLLVLSLAATFLPYIFTTPATN